MTAGGNPPLRPDQALRPLSRAGVGPAPQSGVFIGRLFIIGGAAGGLFAYNGTPAAGNLIASIAAVAGTDPHGNLFFAGLATYQNIGGGVFNSISLQGNTIFFEQSTTGPGGPYNATEQFLAGTSTLFGNTLFLVGDLQTSSNIAALTAMYTGGILKLISGLPETVHTITTGFPAGWTGTFSYWLLADGVSARVAIDFHITIANGTVVANNTDILQAVAAAYHFTDNKFAFGQINGGGLAGNQFAPLRISSTGELFYGGPAFTAAGNAFWYGGSTYAVNV